MRCELPAPRRCCFCVPLRIGLLIAGYVKIILSTLYLLSGSTDLYDVLVHLEFSEHYFLILIFLISTFNSLIDVVFHLIFLIGAHKKEYRKIRWYYRYSIYNIIAMTILFFLNIGLYLDILYLLLRDVMFMTLIFLWTIMIQIYLLILVRSEFLKLKGNTQFQFVNNEADAQCSATIKISDEVDDNDDEMDYDQVSV